MDDYCWPLDDSCCAEFATYPQDVQDRATALAGMTLRMLTAYRVGGCPVTVRPCRKVCEGYIPYYTGQPFGPYNWNGVWFNCTCGGQTCGCGALCQLELPRPIGAVEEVKIDGKVLDPWTYRVDEGRWLVRLDGECWPDCQDLALADTEVGTFSVTYLNAIPVDSLGKYAGGVLACEYAKACAGGKCRLPSGVTSVVRQGVSYEIAAGSFPGGATGIREVDTWIARYNPNHLRTQPAVWTPDEPVLVRTITIPPAVVPPPIPLTYSVTEMTEYPVVDFEDSAGLLIRQVTPTPGQATDAEITSITWENGVVQTPPFDRDVLGRIRHTYTAFGPKDWRVDFTDPGAAPVTGSVHVTYYYYIGWLPSSGIIVVGDSIAIRPLDNWQGNPLPPDEHFAAVDWADGSPIQHPPFTVDGNGYATHVYTAAEVYNIQIGFIDTSTTSLGITVTATQEDLDALSDQPPPVEGKPPPDVP